MKCPCCPDSTLSMTDRQGVEIDFCPQCRGIWLDRGELDKLLERANAAQNPASREPDVINSGRVNGDWRHRGGGDDRLRTGYDKRKKSWLNDIFD